MLGFAPLAIAPLADEGATQRIGIAYGSLALNGASVGANRSIAGLEGSFVWGGASLATVSASLGANSPFALSGDTSAAAGAQAGADCTVTMAGHSAGSVITQLAAGTMVPLPGDARGEISNRASIDGVLVVDRQLHAETAIFGEGARVLPLFGNSAGRGAARAASGGTLLLSGVGLSEATIAASGLAGISVEGAGASSSAISVDLRSSVTVDGLVAGVSLPPLFGHIGGTFGLEGPAAGYVTTEGDSEHIAGLLGLARLQASVAGKSTVPVDMGLASACAMGVGATASPVFLLNGDGRAVANLQSTASTDLTISGATSGLLPIRAKAAGDFAVQGNSATLASLTGTA
ncbi:MAG: hypothetical protein ACNA7M_05075, partial [Roseovarius sp.]